MFSKKISCAILLYLLNFTSIWSTPNYLDSLEVLPLEKLYESFKYANDTKIKERIANTYFRRAKKTGNKVDLADAYRMLINLNLHTGRSLTMCDSIILLTKDIVEKDYPGYGFYIKGSEYAQQGRLLEALDLFVISKRLAKEHDHQVLLLRNDRAIALIHSVVGQTEKAIKELSRTYELFQLNPKWKADDPDNYFSSIFLLAYVLYNKEDFSSAMPLIREGLFVSYPVSKQYYSRFLHLFGSIKSAQGESQEAIDSLQRSLDYVKNSKLTYTCGLSHLGKAFMKANEYDKGIKVFKEIDSLYQYEPLLAIWAGIAYNHLFDYYVSTNNNQAAFQYIDKKANVDKLLLDQQLKIANIDIILDKSQDIIEHVEIIDNLEQKLFSLYTLLFILFLIAVSSITYLLATKDKLVPKKEVETLEEKQPRYSALKKLGVRGEKASVQRLDPELVNRINLGLEDFENQYKFIRPGYSLNSLAKELNTNSSYLSKVINKTKNTNFTNYLNKLRVEYIISKLRTESKLQKYTIHALATESGFNSAQSFTRAFTKYTNKSPTVYIKEMSQQASRI